MRRAALTLVTTGLLATALTACGDGGSSGGSLVIPPPSPTVSFINPPTLVRVGTSTPAFTVQVSVPGGARSTQFVELETFNPLGTRVQREVFNPQQVGCSPGATFCSFNTDFRIAPGDPAGVWQFRITAFDQQNRSGSQTLLITALQ